MMNPETWSLPLPLDGERIVLRAHRADDLDDLTVFHGDAEVTRYIPWPVRDRAQTEAALAAKLTQDVAREVGEWMVLAVEERERGTVIGEVLLKRAGAHDAELGYAFRSDRHGKGLASEAVALLLGHAVPAFALTHVEATVEAPNTGSIRLLERLGFETTDHAERPSGPTEDVSLRRFRLTVPATTERASA